MVASFFYVNPPAERWLTKKNFVQSIIKVQILVNDEAAEAILEVLPEDRVDRVDRVDPVDLVDPPATVLGKPFRIVQSV